MGKRRIVVGIACLLVSYLSFFILPTPFTRFVLSALAMLGVIYIGDGLTYLLQGRSLLKQLKSNHKNFLSFIWVSFLGGLVVDGICKWVLHLWVYPDWSFAFYLFMFVPGFVAYWLTLTESYLGMKAVTEHFAKIPRGLLVITSLLLASAVTSLVCEIQNVPSQLWVYTNWSDMFGNFLGIPVLVFLTWPAQYAVFLVLLKQFGRKELTTNLL